MYERTEQSRSTNEFFSPIQEKAIAFVEGRDNQNVELGINQATDINFLRRIGKMQLEQEIAIYETLGGTARITFGVYDKGIGHSVGNETPLIESQLERGRIDIHTHPHHPGVEPRYGLTPSSGDLRGYLERAKHTNSPSIIINNFGIAIIGINPLKLREEPKSDNQATPKVTIKAFEDFEDQILFRESGDVKDKRMVLYSLAAKLGFILETIPWEDVDKEMLQICFDQNKATQYWLEKDSSTNKSDGNPEEELARVSTVFDEHQKWWKELQKKWINDV